MNRYHLLHVGAGLVVFGVVVSLWTSRITGAAISELVTGPLSYGVGLWLIFAGSVLIGTAEVLERRSNKELRRLDRIIRGGGTVHYTEAGHMARRLGYDVREGGRHLNVYNRDGNLVTEIPRGRGEMPTGTARKILKAFRDGYKEEYRRAA